MGTSLAYLLLAAPLGALADRIGRLPVFLGGYTRPAPGVPAAASARSAAGRCSSLVLALHGAFYAATDGVLIALAGPVLPARLRTTGLALVQTGQALAYLVLLRPLRPRLAGVGAGERDPPAASPSPAWSAVVLLASPSA